MQSIRPAYLETHERGLLHTRVEQALELLGRRGEDGTRPTCRVCPRGCRVARLADEHGYCQVGRYAAVSSFFPHFGEEDCLRGWRGSGTVFFTACNLRCVFCLLPDTHVATDRGVQRIEDIFRSAGDELRVDGGLVRFPDQVEVYTRHGTLAPVARAYCHTYSGEIVRIKPYGLPSIVVTAGHTVFATRAPGAPAQKVPAGQLTTDHWLVVPKLQASASAVALDTYALLRDHATVFRRSVRRRVPVAELQELAAVEAGVRPTSRQIGTRLGYHPAYVRTLLSRLRHGRIDDSEFVANELVQHDERVRFKTEKGQGVTRHLAVDTDLARLLGYYCAEGHVTSGRDRPNSHRLVISHGRHEVGLVERTRDLLRQVFGVEPTVRKRRTTITVEVGSASLALLFKRLCGANAREKQVPPPLLSAPVDVARAFLEAYLEGDGCQQRHYVVTNTVSERLAHGLVALLLRLGIFPYFYATPRPSWQTIEGRRVHQARTLYYVKCRREAWEGTGVSKSVCYVDGADAFYVPVRSLERASYEGPVYNLEIADDDHSYVAHGVAVGNCQNYEVSQLREGRLVLPEELAEIYLALQEAGCHNLNWVTPEHVVPQALEALELAVRRGLRLPLVYNTSAYDSPESLTLLDGVVDVYMPDFKLWDAELARRYLGARDYPEQARRSIKEMHRQVGDLVIDPETGLARRGLLVRHLVMPGQLEQSRQIFRWLAREVSPDTYVNVMAQYYPAGAVVQTDRYPELQRRLTGEEYRRALAIAREEGLRRFDERSPRRLLALG